jgi:hypothetical protein
VFGERHVIVIFTVIAETAEISGFLALMTVVTLMTVLYRLILDRGCASTSWAITPST